MKTVKDTYCIFLDILGFSELIKEANNKGSSNDLLKRFSDVFENSYFFLGDISINSDSYFGDGNIYIKSFTDNIVIALDIESGHGEGEFGSMLISCSNFQLVMALEGYFVRGAFVRGELYLDDRIVFGNAILDAFDLENKVARDPIIILSDEVLDDVIKQLKFYRIPENSPQYDSVLIDSDNVAFINYLTNVHQEYLHWDAIELHKKVVEEKLVKHINTPTIWNKYRWVASYHNWFCSDNSSDPNYSDEYLIESDHFMSKPKRLE
jgi:hypothetical protein